MFAGSIGWVMADRAARQQQTEYLVAKALDEAQEWQDKERWPEALSAAKRAAGLLAAGEADDEMRELVAKRLADLEMAIRVDDIRTPRQALTMLSLRDWPGLDTAYQTAFRDYGIDVANLETNVAAERIRASTIRTQLLAALDDWTFARAKRGAGTEESLLELAQLADDDPWRQRLRDPKIRGNQAALESLATEKGILDQPPADLVLLSQLLFAANAKTTALLLLRQAQQRYPGDFWICDTLADYLTVDPGAVTEGLGYARVTVALRLHSATARNNLAIFLQKSGKSAQAEQEYRTAIQLDPKFAEAHFNLGLLLQEKGKLTQAEQEYRTSIQLKPEFAGAHNNLGLVLNTLKKFNRAEEEYQNAISLKPLNVALAHFNLGACLQDQGKLADAEKEYRKAIKSNEQFADPHFALGVLLRNQGNPAEAEKKFRKAISLQPNHALAHLSLGKLLASNGKLDLAEKEFRTTIGLNPNLADGHYNLGVTLTRKPKQDVDGAIACYQKAIALVPNHAEVHCNLGDLLRRQGHFAEALKHLKIGDEQGSKKPGWHYPSAKWVQQCEALLALDQKLATIQAGKTQPAGAVEQLNLAMFCRHCKEEYLAAAQFYAAAFSGAPTLAENMTRPIRYDAACAAILAAAGAGKGAGQLDAKQKAEWRQQALHWLAEDLKRWQRQANGDPTARKTVITTLSKWQTDPNLASVRTESNLAELPKEERKAWQTLWTDVAGAIKKANM
jgi:tetratricopeptide (TPR) repeat protein